MKDEGFPEWTCPKCEKVIKISEVDLAIQEKKHHGTIFGTVPPTKDMLVKNAIVDAVIEHKEGCMIKYLEEKE